ncbi:MAG: hypothetical protein JST17_10115 [Bacteroidetes bacterium]|nr:hypothetical protein [Bacteroidota bacterium]MBS1930062.1 hypothetical protein [Bacteroidota bacterium]
MKKLTCFLTCIILFNAISFSQSIWELGAEAQHAFGKGANDNMIGGRYEGFSNKNSWSFGLTYNFSSKKSYSEYSGFGFYVGYRRGFSYSNSGNGNAFLGFRATFLFNNFAGKEKANSSSIMPTFEGGYQFIFGTHVYTSPTIGYGYEIKLSKDNNSLNEDEGSRFIPGISMGYRF